jgi:hypothetical protein
MPPGSPQPDERSALLEDAGSPWAGVPAEVGEAMRPWLPGMVAAVVAAVRAEVPEYDQPLEGEFGRLISQGTSAALGQFVDLLGRDVAPPDLTTYVALGRAEHRQGRTLDALQAAYRVGARVAWRHMVAFGEQGGLEPRVVYRLAEAIFAYIERLAAASVAGFAQAEAAQAGSLQARRHALIELLVRDSAADPADVERAAAQAGWRLPARVAALAVEHGDPAALARRMPAGTIGTALEPVGMLLVPDPDAPHRAVELEAALSGHRGVLGPAVPCLEAHHSAARASAAWPLHAAGRLGDAALVRADDHPLALLLVGDPGLARDLVRGRLAPLAAMTPLARERAARTLRAWLDLHGDVSAAAAALHVHPQTVRHRLAALRSAFDGALDDPVGRLELALALRAADQLELGEAEAP